MDGEWNAESRVMSRFLAGPTAQKVISRAMENGGRSSPGCSLILEPLYLR